MAEKGYLDFSLLANFVHQVINPLNGVTGTLDNLIDGTIVEEHRRGQRLKAARAQLEHCIMLVRNLAYFSQISLDPGNTNPGKVQKICVIPQVIIEAAMYFQEMAESRGMKIDLVDRETQYRVVGNPDLLRQVFMNMFDNAVKYGDNNSLVTVEPWIQKSTSRLIVKITSSGTAIPVDERDKVFQLGFRSPTAKVKIASGTGLGLYICRTIIKEVHDGDITVESSISNRVTSFLIRFPKWEIS
jgi:signal transduction histidine kinase